MTTAIHFLIFPRRLLRLLLLLTALLRSPDVSAQPAAAPADIAVEKTPPPAAKEVQSSNAHDFDRIRFNNESASHYANDTLPATPAANGVFFFPPVPPALGAEIPLLGPLSRGPLAPVELASFVDEFFYPLLAARLIADDLPKTLRTQLQAYRTEKTGLQNELRTRLVGLKDAAAGESGRQFAVFAASQSPRIAQLEELAEKIRAGLRRTGPFGSTPERDDWPEPAGWHGRNAPTEPADLHLEAAVLRSTAYLQDGLSLAQRRLLLGMAVQLMMEANPGPEGRLFTFAPEAARVRLPADLPAPLAGKIGEYASLRQGLLAELRGVLQSTEPGRSPRSDALKHLAVVQAPRFAALESAAEDIRRDLALLPNPPGPPAPPSLPMELTARISVYRAHKLELLKTLATMLGSPVGGSARKDEPADETPKWLHDGTAPTAVPLASLKVSAEEFNRRQRELLGELNQEQAGIRQALADFVRTENQPTDRKSINDLLRDFESARQRQETWEQYRDYQAAVLQPGLSPGQRRLLFSAAVEQLALPLPAGESAP